MCRISCDGRCFPSCHRCCPGGAHAGMPVRRDGIADPSGQGLLLWKKHPPTWTGAHCHPGGEIYQPHHCPPPVADLIVGRLLSIEVYSIVGSCLLLFDNQLLHGRLRRYPASVGVAELRRHRKHHGCFDVWALGELPVRARDGAGAARATVVARADEIECRSRRPRARAGRLPALEKE